ncbi:hypothetical protein GPALN_012335 [Globodera pallida]|nr:hypothetical protein GPALN_012335 [Globodera pallida]
MHVKIKRGNTSGPTRRRQLADANSPTPTRRRKLADANSPTKYEHNGYLYLYVNDSILSLREAWMPHPTVLRLVMCCSTHSQPTVLAEKKMHLLTPKTGIKFKSRFRISATR